MKAAILCPGPSLATADIDAAAALIVGVNRAALAFHVDAWCCCDLPAIERWQADAIGSPLLISDAETFGELEKRSVPWRGPVFDRREMAGFCPDSFIVDGQLHKREWLLYSATTALVYAAFRGATEIAVYGADWEGTADYDGVQAGANRRPERWEAERAIWERRLVPWMRERGIDVERVPAKKVA